MRPLPITLLLVASLAAASCKSKASRPPESEEPAPESAAPAALTCAKVGELSPIRPLAEPPPIWLVITRPVFADAIAALAEHRRAEGFEVVVSTEPPAQAIAALDRAPGYILLIGDEIAGAGAEPWRLASHWRKLYRWRAPQRTEFAADPLWGDRDGDLVPEIPVGRIPAREPGQVATAVAKILAFESQPATAKALRMPVWVGAAGYSPELDSMATTTLLGVLEAKGPKWARWWLMTGDPQHPLAGWPPSQPGRFSEQLASGGGFAFLMGHGNTARFHSMTWQGESIDYTPASAAELPGKGVGPVLFIFTCESGNFTAAGDSLGESLFFLPGGPVATIGATTESHPLTNYFSGEALVSGLGTDAHRLGDMWLAVQRRASKMKNLFVQSALADVEGKLDAEIDVGKLRRDQLLMYAILGDPATRLRKPQPLAATIAASADACRWQAEKPSGADHLQVDFMPADRQFGTAAGDNTDEQAAAQRFAAADATFAFQPLAELSATEDWRGNIARAGTLRLTATGASGVHVSTFAIE